MVTICQTPKRLERLFQNSDMNLRSPSLMTALGSPQSVVPSRKVAALPGRIVHRLEALQVTVSAVSNSLNGVKSIVTV